MCCSAADSYPESHACHGASAKEIHCTALAHQFDRLLPASGMPTASIAISTPRFRVKARVSRMAARIVASAPHAPRQLARRLCLAVVLHNGDGLAAGQRGTCRSSAQGSPPIRHRIAGARARVLEAMHRTGQRLGAPRAPAGRDRYMERILCRDARRNADELGVSAVIEEQIVAEILLRASAK